ncbi:MAG TPA: group 1 truncated hemoglobin [Kofleriaceae bacterium]|nr:group 1 truncated hemoglobin [Kofleriaceae bacterium]
MKSSTLFERIGADALRAVVTDFYGRVFGDVMIGFMFRGKDRQHLIDREYELTAALLGATGVTYRGRPMREAHAQHTIFGGQFERRLQILRETLRDHGVDPEVQEAWIAHQLALRGQITRDRGSECEEAGPAPAEKAADPSRPVKLGRR